MFGIMAGKYRWNQERFGMIVDFCFFLANFHIRLHPLREQDYDYYQKVLADLKRRTEEQSTMVKKRQQKHWARQARMKAVMENLDVRGQTRVRTVNRNYRVFVRGSW